MTHTEIQHSGAKWTPGNAAKMLSMGGMWEDQWGQAHGGITVSTLRSTNGDPEVDSLLPLVFLLSRHALLSPQTWFLGSCRAQPIWRHGKSKECSKAPIAIQTSTSLITTSQGCLLSLLAVPYLLVRDSIIHAMLIAGILGYLCQANCCGIAAFMLS